jgi:Rps23 Pro-64 3,4-dihydroxylase Tpa1-like proline 4-hydroxylase
MEKCDLADLIVQRIDAEAERLACEYAASQRAGCGITTIDGLFTKALFDNIRSRLPEKATMLRRKSLGERKFCLAQTGEMQAALRDCVTAFASQRVARHVGEVLGIGPLTADSDLYNGGITYMQTGDFMRPHLDNSHNRDRRRRRRIALLYYLADDWSAQQGGALKIWSRRPRRIVTMVPYRPNRLVFMEVGDNAWHSVERISGGVDRINLTTYFYDAVESNQTVRLTRFMAWPGEPLAQMMLDAQFGMRMLAQRLGMGGLARNSHTNTAR